MPRTVICQAVFASPLGKLGINANETAVTDIFFLPIEAQLLTATTEMAQLAQQQLEHYFNNAAYRFTVPLAIDLPGVSVFQQQVLHQLQCMPLGQIASYSAVAQQLNTSSRAVGVACARNRIPVIIPCHRVVARQGLGGFGGFGKGDSLLNIKRWLLQHEGATF